MAAERPYTECAAYRMPIERLAREAHVWLMVPESVQDEARLEACRAVLSESELARYERFRFPQDRHRYLVSHALVRNVLSRYLEIPPAEWVFFCTSHGRPEIANPEIPPLRFNLTHTTGLAACVVTLSDPCGIDAERIAARHDPLGVARRMFSEAEYEQLSRLAGLEQLQYFFTRWTLREAYVKARGIGISFPTHKLRFNVDPAGLVSVTFQLELKEQIDRWQFRVLRPTPQHIGAIAISRSGDLDKKLVVRNFDL